MPSSTAIRTTRPAAAAGFEAVVADGRRDRAPVEGVAERRLDQRPRSDVDRSVEPVEDVGQRGVLRRVDQHRAHGRPEPISRRTANAPSTTR